ncbi:MAG: SUMF1/EgtB/PvdO family nonheme iron enzyme [Polyangiaceae bacterium]
MSVRVAAAVGFALGVVSLAAVVKSLRVDVDPALLTAAAGPRPLAHTWRLFREHHWQIVTDKPIESRDVTDAAEGNRGVCPAGMIEVKGQMKLDPSPNAFYDKKSVEEMQKTTCTRWINRDFPERCAEFDRDKWLELSKDLATKPMHFCIDRFEYPNQKGAFPVIMVNYHESQALCEEQGKRLCDEAEWTFACEGDEALPYPYGYSRDDDACTIDKKWRAYNGAAFANREADPARDELDRLWQGKASGAMARCKSPFGVYDMTGNVDEWTRTVREYERPSILKGGYWGPVRTRCRPSTRSHDENHTFYQQGFRCCSEASTKPRRVEAEDPAIAPLPRQLK